MFEKSLIFLVLWAILFQGMYKFNSFLSLLNKSIALLITFSLLSISFSFNIDETVKQEFGMLYKSTSISEYYNSITNFSYGIINKILESTKINLVPTATQKDNAENKENKSTGQKDLYFVKTTTENDLKVSRNVNDCSVSLLNENSYCTPMSNNIIFKFHTFKLTCITILFCYFARDSIGENIINNITGKVRLV